VESECSHHLEVPLLTVCVQNAAEPVAREVRFLVTGRNVKS
jgi:hypothetical protein